MVPYTLEAESINALTTTVSCFWSLKKRSNLVGLCGWLVMAFSCHVADGTNQVVAENNEFQFQMGQPLLNLKRCRPPHVFSHIFGFHFEYIITHLSCFIFQIQINASKVNLASVFYFHKRYIKFKITFLGCKWLSSSVIFF